MSQEIIHVYLMPGMAASPKIFENTELPIDQFEMHLLEWVVPIGNEELSSYALRMTGKIEHEDIILLGVSFGGVLVQEMSKHIKVRKLIIVSSIKSISELPSHMVFAKKTKAYKLVPTQLLGNLDMFSKYIFVNSISKRIERYKKYLAFSDPDYLNWAIEKMVCWEQEEYEPNIIHIHGDKDPIFPISNINNCITVKNGTHIMIINKYKWFNENLPLIILGD